MTFVWSLSNLLMRITRPGKKVRIVFLDSCTCFTSAFQKLSEQGTACEMISCTWQLPNMNMWKSLKNKIKWLLKSCRWYLRSWLAESAGLIGFHLEATESWMSAWILRFNGFCAALSQVCGGQNYMGNLQTVPLGTCSTYQPCTWPGML